MDDSQSSSPLEDVSSRGSDLLHKDISIEDIKCQNEII